MSDDLKTALRAVVEALPGATKGPYATHLVDDTLLVGGNGIEVASAVGSYENDSEAYQMERNMAFLSTAANLARHAPALLAMVEEVERLREARNAALEEAAGVADEEERNAEDLRNERPNESYHWGFWERARKSASAIAAAIRARKTPAGGGGPTIPAQDTEERT
ncbi:MAG: hypothetical protein EBR82_48285 [Caulobacteraceae bacterium]|nr:hypothetical protein [Caulobacteraceae bacterium]